MYYNTTLYYILPSWTQLFSPNWQFNEQNNGKSASTKECLWPGFRLNKYQSFAFFFNRKWYHILLTIYGRFFSVENSFELCAMKQKYKQAKGIARESIWCLYTSHVQCFHRFMWAALLKAESLRVEQSSATNVWYAFRWEFRMKPIFLQLSCFGWKPIPFQGLRWMSNKRWMYANGSTLKLIIWL